MNRRERLLATLAGRPVDRVPVSFYELDWFVDRWNDPDEFNVYHDPSWRPLLEMVRERVDRIVCTGDDYIVNGTPELGETQVEIDAEGRRLTTRIEAGDRVLQSRTFQSRDTFTVWTTEHLLKDADDLRAYLELPETPFDPAIDVAPFLEAEKRLGDGGIMLLDTPDPLCHVAPLFEMGEYTIIALTEPELFDEALHRASRLVYARVEALAAALPGRLWRIFGPEYASEPYLPPDYFARYVTPYVTRMVEIIHRTGGYARIHSHGNLRNILPHIAATGCDGLDPIEPEGQGDVSLKFVRENYGKQMVLFGNLEITDIENDPPEKLREKVLRALDEGTSGAGRGMVLMPSSAPYGRKLPLKTLKNYELVLDTACQSAR